MKIHLTGAIVFTLLVACMNKQAAHHYKKTNSKIDIVKVYNDNRSFLWHGGGINLLCFSDKKVEYYFNASCMYTFDTKLQDDSIVILWGLNSDCTFDRGISNKVDSILSPTDGEIFASCKLIGDSTLMIKYHFEVWRKFQNLKAKDVDTLFPIQFRLN